MLRMNLSVAALSVSQIFRVEMPRAVLKARAWNSDWLPEPIIAMTLESGRASLRATMAEVAAVRSAVSTVISVRKVG